MMMMTMRTRSWTRRTTSERTHLVLLLPIQSGGDAPRLPPANISALLASASCAAMLQCLADCLDPEVFVRMTIDTLWA